VEQVGAAVACPERRVVALQADGSAMYTIQSLWTMGVDGKRLFFGAILLYFVL
jgi:thiamine pyrophosphate-dependent acetolactate synthase large subunit-like protein